MSRRLSGWARLWIAIVFPVWGLDAWFGWSAWTSEPLPQAGFRAILAFLVFVVALVPLLVAGMFAVGNIRSIGAWALASLSLYLLILLADALRMFATGWAWHDALVNISSESARLLAGCVILSGVTTLLAYGAARLTPLRRPLLDIALAMLAIYLLLWLSGPPSTIDGWTPSELVVTLVFRYLALPFAGAVAAWTYWLSAGRPQQSITSG